MMIKILGTGCSKCKAMEANARLAIAELGIEATIEKVEDVQEIMKFGIMSTPALVVNDKVVVLGKVPTVEAIKAFLL